MALFTRIDDQKLEAARSHVVASDQVCPSCKAPFSTSGKSLTSVNAELGLEAHTCPACGHEIWIRRAAPPAV